MYAHNYASMSNVIFTVSEKMVDRLCSAGFVTQHRGKDKLMMKLKHLLDNRELVLHLLEYWDYDQEKPEILDQFRISSNAIYPFYRDGKVCLLRFAPITEKSFDSVQAEMEFMAYLHSHGLSVPRPVEAKNGKTLLLCDTPWGVYTAAAFHRVPGKRMDMIDFDANLLKAYGKNLAELHLLSRAYSPKGKRRNTWQEQLDWAEGCLLSCHAPDIAIKEMSTIRSALSSLSIDSDNYGLIHYDYELDNVFFNAESGLISTIDFDDSHYHWYGMDMERALSNLEEELEAEQISAAKESFLSGYSSLIELGSDTSSSYPVFKRYAGIIQYTRCLRAGHEKLDGEPDWMIGLRQHLSHIMQNNAKAFGTDL